MQSCSNLCRVITETDKLEMPKDVCALLLCVMQLLQILLPNNDKMNLSAYCLPGLYFFFCSKGQDETEANNQQSSPPNENALAADEEKVVVMAISCCKFVHAIVII